MGSAGVHLAELQVIACVLDCQLPRTLGMWEQMHSEFLFPGTPAPKDGPASSSAIARLPMV